MEFSSTPPAVPSDNVGFDGRSRILPACKDSYITQEFFGEQPTISTFGCTVFKYPPIPDIRPPPPTATMTVSILLKSSSSSTPIVPCPATITGSLYGEMYIAPVVTEISWARCSASRQSLP